MSADDLSQASLLDLFRMEADTQAQVLTSGLLALEREGTAADQLELCMRAAHSLKGAARIVGLAAGVRVAHAMEDCFVAAQRGGATLGAQQIDWLLAGTDLLTKIANTPAADLAQWDEHRATEVEACLATLARMTATPSITTPAPDGHPTGPSSARPGHPAAAPCAADVQWVGRSNEDRVLRVTAESLNRLLALAAESLVESRWVKPYAESLLRLKRMQRDCCTLLDNLRQRVPAEALDERTETALVEARRKALDCHRFLSLRLAELEMFDGRSLSLSHRLYDEALACRMRPFGDGVLAFPRMVRDLAHALGKQVRLDIVGETTQVDRDVLAKLDAPLGHLLRNAVDHGIEAPDARRAAGKPLEGVVRLEARHHAGALHVTLSDDGRGIDAEQMREAVVRRGLISFEAARTLSEPELLEFLFLPGFTMASAVTDISGRGVGLDVVQDMVKRVRGTVRVSSQIGGGTRFVLQLPVTLSVVRTLLAEIGGEPYAFPLASIARAVHLPTDRIELLEGRQHCDVEGKRIGLVTAHQLLGIEQSPTVAADLSVIVLGDSSHTYGVVVDRFLGERELVVQPLDVQLGKVKNISAGAVMEDGSPVLIVDVEDLLRSTDRLVDASRPGWVRGQASTGGERRRKRVLVVDDSLTVRELERKLLGNRGYEVEVAIDGVDGWNAVRTGHFDLVVTDVDMPRMDGIELVSLINKDPVLKSLPVMVVSYKDRDEDRRRGLEAGAAYYLTKGSFHDETLLQAVSDLIGEAEA